MILTFFPFRTTLSDRNKLGARLDKFLFEKEYAMKFSSASLFTPSFIIVLAISCVQICAQANSEVEKTDSTGSVSGRVTVNGKGQSGVDVRLARMGGVTAGGLL